MRRGVAASTAVTVAAAAGLLVASAPAAKPLTIPAGATTKVSLPKSKVVARCTPPGEFHPNPTLWSVSPTSVKVTGTVKGMPKPGAQLSVTVPKGHALAQSIVISWTGNSACVSFNGSIEIRVSAPGSARQPPGAGGTKAGGSGACAGPSPTHTRLAREPWRTSPKVLKAVKQANARLQSNKEEVPRDFAFDEFAITIEQMPPGVSPEQLLEKLASDPNGTVDNPAFSALTSFNRRGQGQVRVGEIYDIRIPGNDGSVVLVEKSADHFVVQTIEVLNSPIGRHPVSGARQFGFERNGDGSVTFYTRGADRPDDELLRAPGLVAQNAAWSAMMHGLRNQIRRQGGKVRSGPIKIMRVDRAAGC